VCVCVYMHTYMCVYSYVCVYMVLMDTIDGAMS